jgi:hypothetical protein
MVLPATLFGSSGCAPSPPYGTGDEEEGLSFVEIGFLQSKKETPGKIDTPAGQTVFFAGGSGWR